MTEIGANRSIINDAIIKDISDSIHNIQNGMISIHVKDSRILRIEETRENRYEDIWEVEDGGGI